MQKWEYCLVYTLLPRDENTKQKAILNYSTGVTSNYSGDEARFSKVYGELGDSGWEAVSFNAFQIRDAMAHHSLFKRPVP